MNATTAPPCGGPCLGFAGFALDPSYSHVTRLQLSWAGNAST